LLRRFAPNEANAIEYERAAGMELLPHCDDRQMSSDILVNLSLDVGPARQCPPRHPTSSEPSFLELIDIL
jgi:hypothetical protein